jgi:hypothetical protein
MKIPPENDYYYEVRLHGVVRLTRLPGAGLYEAATVDDPVAGHEVLVIVGNPSKVAKTTLIEFATNEFEAKTNYPKFQPSFYSLDCFLPIIDLKQKSAWSPNANKGYEVVKPSVGFRVRWGGLLRGYLWAHTLLGWALTTLWVAGFTGLVRRLN